MPEKEKIVEGEAQEMRLPSLSVPRKTYIYSECHMDRE